MQKQGAEILVRNKAHDEEQGSVVNLRGRCDEECNAVLQQKIKHWGYSSAGRAPALHAGGQRFDPA